MSIENFESIIAKSLMVHYELESPSFPKETSIPEALSRILEIIDIKLEGIEDERSEIKVFSNYEKKEINFYISKSNHKLLIYYSRIMLYTIRSEDTIYVVNGLRVNINHKEHKITFTREVDKKLTDVITLIDTCKGFLICVQSYKQPSANNELLPPVVKQYTPVESDVESLYPRILDRFQIGKKNNDKE